MRRLRGVLREYDTRFRSETIYTWDLVAVPDLR
jgi:hypothetical protein